MTYVIRVVGPAGLQRYLSEDQREVEFSKDAQHFTSRADAERVADAYFDVARKCWSNPPYVGVDDQEGP